jgi:hypothetical protein
MAIKRMRVSDLNRSSLDIFEHFSFNKFNSGYINVSTNSQAKSTSSSFGT